MRACYGVKEGVNVVEPWKVANCPEEAGVSSKGVLAFLDALQEAGIEPHSILVLRNGMLACKMNFAPYDDQTPHVLFSLSKSFTSAAAGFAVAEGLLSWDSKVLDVLADKAPEAPDQWLQQVTLHHLLCMGSGLDPASDAFDSDAQDWVKAVLACGCDAEPGTRFHYNSHGTYLISAMVQRVTGMNIRDYLMPRLFEPLGIPKPEWDVCPQGICVGGWGLHLSTDSIARFGQCLLQKGMWQGKQVLPVEWLEKATVSQIDNAHREPKPHADWAQGYGYQFWRTRGNRYRGDGMYGQICMVSPEQNMVVAITAGLNDIGKELDLLNDFLFPAADMEPGTPEEQQLLKLRLEQLGYPWPVHDDDASELADCYEGEGAGLRIGALGVECTFRNQWTAFCGFFGWGEPVAHVQEHCFPAAPPLSFLLCAGWKDGRLSLLGRSKEAPFTVRAEAVRNEAGLLFHMEGAGCPNQTIQLNQKHK